MYSSQACASTSYTAPSETPTQPKSALDRVPKFDKRTAAASADSIRLLAYKTTSPANPSIGIQTREPSAVLVGDSRGWGVYGSGGGTGNQYLDNDNRASHCLIGKLNPELARRLLTLHDHPAALQSHKEQIDLLRDEICTIINCIKDYRELDREGTTDFLNIVLSRMSARLALIETSVTGPPAFPPENLDALYNLAKAQVPFHNTPFALYSTLVLSLNETKQSPTLPDTTSQPTKDILTQIEQKSPLSEAMSEAAIKQFVEEQAEKISSLAKDSNTSPQVAPTLPLTFACRHRLYMANQNIGLSDGTLKATDILATQLGLSSDKILFPGLDDIVKVSIMLDLQFTSLLIALDRRRSYSDSQNHYDIPAQRWAMDVLKRMTPGSPEEHSTFFEDLKSQMSKIETAIKKLPDTFKGDSAAFVSNLFTSNSGTKEHPFTAPLIESFENWLFDGLCHCYGEVLDDPESDPDEVAHLDEVKNIVRRWNENKRTTARTDWDSNQIENITKAIESVTESMKCIRQAIYVNPDHSLLEQMYQTEHGKSAREFFLNKHISLPGNTSQATPQATPQATSQANPFQQIGQLFVDFEKEIKAQNRGLFDKTRMVKAYAHNCRIQTKSPIEPWQIKFVESVLMAKKHKTTEEVSGQEGPPKTDFLHRSLKNPSVLGKGMGMLGNLIAKGFIPQPYHKAHKFHEDDGLSHKVNLCCSSDKGFETNFQRDITIDWNKSIGCTAKNYLQDHDANHSPSGELEENVAGLDNAIPTHDVLKNWYEAFKKSTAKHFAEQQSLPGPPKKQFQEAIFELSALAEKKSSVDLDHGDFLIKRFRSLWPDDPGQEHKDQLKSLESMVNDTVGHYRKSKFSLLAPHKTSVAPLDPMELSLKQKTFCKGLKPFFDTIIHEICSKDFRHDLTADLHSVQIMMQIVGFLNMQLAGEDPEPRIMHELLGLSHTTFRTLEEYACRLNSEHFEHKKDLLGERLYEMFSKADPISRKKSTFISALQNHSVTEFMADVDAELKKTTASQTPPLKGLKSALNSVQQTYEKVLANLKKQHQRARMQDSIPCMIGVGADTYSEMSPKEYLQKLHNKIQAGETMIEALKAAIDEMKLGNETASPLGLWTRISEWIENHEASIMCTYGAGMLISVYYLAMGGSHKPNLYSTGGELNFGSFDATSSSIPQQLYTSFDIAQIATTIGAVSTQIGQATGWKNDVRRMLEMLEGADSLSFVGGELPTTLKSHMFNLHLSEFKPDDINIPFETVLEKGYYRRSKLCSKDTAKDVTASVLTRRSPLQKSHPYIDRCLRVVGSAATGAVQGITFFGLSSTASTLIAPACPWAPTIPQAFPVMVAVGAAAGAVGGAASQTRFDYISRGLNFSTRAFGSDRVMGGMPAQIAQVVKTMRSRRDSTLVRLVIENPFKAALNISGSSIPESFLKFFLHFFDGYIAQIEISDFAEWRKAQQVLTTTSTAFTKAHDGKELTQFELNALKATLGEEAVEWLGLQCRPDPKIRTAQYFKLLTAAGNLVGHYIMIADLYFFLYQAASYAQSKVPGLSSIKHGLSKVPGLASTTSATTALPPTSPASNSSVPTPTMGENTTFTNIGNSTNSTIEDTCPAETKSLPLAGKGKFECWVALYEEFRKSDPFRRFFNVAAFKSIPNFARFFEVQAHNATLGKKSYDPAMVTTLVAGLAKNSALGPLERLLQMSPEILSKCIGDIVNQMNTNIKEAMESVGQRQRDKATEAMKKAGKDILWRLMVNANYDLTRAESDMVRLLTYWQTDVGFLKLNAIASLREMITVDQLETCDATVEFTDYKATLTERLQSVMPSFGNKLLKVPEELLGPVQKLRDAVDRFVNDVNTGKDMFRSIAPLLAILSGIDMKVVDAYIENELFKPLIDQSELLNPFPSWPARNMTETAVPSTYGVHRRHQHSYV